jgi:hypothetical protein
VEQLRRLIADLLLDCGVIADLSCSSGILATPTLLWDHAAFRKAVRDHNQSRIPHSAEIIVACQLPRRLVMICRLICVSASLPSLIAAHADLCYGRRHCQLRFGTILLRMEQLRRIAVLVRHMPTYQILGVPPILMVVRRHRPLQIATLSPT